MKIVKFIEVQMMEAGDGKIALRKVPRYIIPKNVGSISPGAVPGETVGLDGEPIMLPGAYLHVQGEHILVNCAMDEATWKLSNESVEIKKPESLDEENESKIIS